MVSRLVITFLPRSKNLLISWLQSQSAMILKPQKKSATVSPSTVCVSLYRERETEGERGTETGGVA